MAIIKKSDSGFTPYGWLNFNRLSDSNGYKFELYLTQEEIASKDMIDIFYHLLKPYIDNIEVGMFKPEAGGWGDFCLDTWNIHDDSYDYDPIGKSPETARYLKMIQENAIEPSYQGLCICLDWEQFLLVVLDCIMTGKAPYSIICYCPSYEFMFYFHYTGSLGIYYKNFNDAILHILKQAKAADLELWNWTDEKSLASLRGE